MNVTNTVARNHAHMHTHTYTQGLRLSNGNAEISYTYIWGCRTETPKIFSLPFLSYTHTTYSFSLTHKLIVLYRSL